MAKVKYIPIDIYKRYIYIFIGSLDEFKSWVQKEYNNDEEKAFVSMVMNIKEDEIGMASFNWDRIGGTGVVLIPKYPKTPKGRAALGHELLHATFFIIDLCRVEYIEQGNNEAFTYLFEYLERNALENIGYEEIKEDGKVQNRT